MTGKIHELIQRSVPMSPEAIVKAFQDRIDKFDFDGISVDSVEIGLEGEVYVSFVDSDDEQLDIIFAYDDEDGVSALVVDDEEDEEYTVIDLDPLDPSTVIHGIFGQKYPDLVNLEWLNRSALGSLFVAGDFDDDEDIVEPELTQDDIEQEATTGTRVGYMTVMLDGESSTNEEYVVFNPSLVLLTELKKTVIRGGKKVRLAVVRKVKRKILKSKQKAAIRKAVRKRKIKAVSIKRKLKKALRIRNRMGLKKQSLGKFRKVAGTADRKT